MQTSKSIQPGIGDQRGMTLLEIMLALLILGTVMTMVSISLSGSLNILNATREQGQIYHRAQVALLRISEDLTSSILVDDIDFVGEDEQVGGQDGDSLQFTSTAHIVFNKEEDTPGIAVISYGVQEDPEREGELILLRADELLAQSVAKGGQIGQREGLILSDRLKSINFRYYNEEGDDLDAWTTEADELAGQEERKLPVAVSCTLEFWVDRDDETSIEFSTSVLLPVGMISAEKKQGQKGS